MFNVEVDDDDLSAQFVHLVDFFRDNTVQVVAVAAFVIIYLFNYEFDCRYE